MNELSPRVLHVSPSDSDASYQSISEAAQDASEGDQIVVGSGSYSSKTTNENFPIYIPPTLSTDWFRSRYLQD